MVFNRWGNTGIKTYTIQIPSGLSVGESKDRFLFIKKKKKRDKTVVFLGHEKEEGGGMESFLTKWE